MTRKAPHPRPLSPEYRGEGSLDLAPNVPFFVRHLNRHLTLPLLE